MKSKSVSKPLNPYSINASFFAWPVKAFQLFVLLVLCPKRLHETFQHLLSHEISPTTSLLELSRQQILHKKLKRLLQTGFIGLPLIATIAVSIWILFFNGQLTAAIGIGSLFGVVIGVLFAYVVGIAAGIGMAIATLIPLSWLFGYADYVALDLMSGNGLGLTVGIGTAIVSHILTNLTLAQETDQAITRSPLRRLGNAIIGIVAAVVLLGLLTFFVTSVVAAWTQLSIFGVSSVPLIASIPIILMIISGRIRSNHWRRAITLGTIYGLLLVVGIGSTMLPVGVNYNAEIYGKPLILFMLLMVYIFFLPLYFFTFSFTLKITDLWTATVAGGVGSLGIHFILQMISSGFYIPWPHLATHALLLMLGLTSWIWLPIVLYPFELAWSLFLYRYESNWQGQQSLLRFNPVFWDELQYLRLAGLDDHLMLANERDDPQYEQFNEHIINSKQSWAAQSVQIERTIRQLEAAKTIEQIAQSTMTLPTVYSESEVEALLFSLRRPSEDTAAALAQPTEYNRRLVLTEVRDRLNGQLDELTRRNTPAATRFRPLIMGWRNTLNNRLEQAADAQEIPNPYIVGVPLTHRQQLFVGRVEISRRIEGILRDQNHPPLLLYGQRRMGKTSLIYQLRWMLPRTVMPLVVDLQGPVSLAKDHASFLYNFAKGIHISAVEQGISLEMLLREELADDAFTVFDDWLDELDAALSKLEQHTVLLALDEFEALDKAISNGKLEEEAILGTLRHIIQHRPHFKLMLVGSHHLDDFRRWSTYLINAQTLHLSYLQEDEARQLIEKPINDSPLVYAPQATHRVLVLTRGHPYLIQLLCAEIVMSKNLDTVNRRFLVTEDDVNATISETLKRGSMFFDDIGRHQVEDGDLPLLLLIAQRADGSTEQEMLAHCGSEAELKQTLLRLQDRELITPEGGKYIFQVELIRLWFAQ